MRTRNIALGLALLGSVATHRASAQQALQRQEPPDEPLKFEVVSVRPYRGDTGIGGRISAQPGGRFIVQNMPLRLVLLTAYDIRPYQLVDAPTWVQTERFEITALTGRDEFSSVVQMQPLIQALLADRFQLQIAREQRVVQTYALVRVRADALGPQMRSVNTDCTSPERRDFANANSCGTRVREPGTLTGIATESSSLARALDALIGTVVTDETGLRGPFDFTLKWSPDNSTGAADGVPIVTAVQEQLGLKLEPRRTTVEVVVVKRIERPTEN